MLAHHLFLLSAANLLPLVAHGFQPIPHAAIARRTTRSVNNHIFVPTVSASISRRNRKKNNNNSDNSDDSDINSSYDQQPKQQDDQSNNDDDERQTIRNQSNKNDRNNDYDDSRNNRSSSNNISIFKRLDRAGQSLKPKAERSHSKAALVETKLEKIRYKVQSIALYTLFLFFRAYRGFFVILPAVYTENSRKLVAVVDGSPFDMPPTPTDSFSRIMSSTNASSNSDDDDDDVSSNWRTSLTVSVLAATLTVSYALGGALRVFTKFCKQVPKLGMYRALGVAVEEQEQNMIMLAKKNGNNKRQMRSSNGLNGNGGK